MFDKIAAGAALLFQVTGAGFLGIVTAEVVSPGLDPALVSAYGAISALFGLATWLAKGRIERCEKQQDGMLGTQSEQTATMRELAAAVNKAADVTGDAVAATAASAVELKSVSNKLDVALGNVGKLESTVNGMAPELAGLRREIERMASNPSGRAR